MKDFSEWNLVQVEGRGKQRRVGTFAQADGLATVVGGVQRGTCLRTGRGSGFISTCSTSRGPWKAKGRKNTLGLGHTGPGLPGAALFSGLKTVGRVGCSKAEDWL